MQCGGAVVLIQCGAVVSQLLVQNGVVGVVVLGWLIVGVGLCWFVLVD